MTDKHSNLIWIDLEMTGLNPDTDRIIEIATIVTDKHLNELAQGPVLAVHQSDEVLAAMDEGNTRTPGESGVVARVRASTVGEAAVEEGTLTCLRKWVAEGASPICGNTMCQDRRFLWRYMPQLEAYFHYRNLDVSTVKELARRWAAQVLEGVQKRGSHKALDDIQDSISELRYYRENLFNLEG